jgi:hypothetical protein
MTIIVYPPTRRYAVVKGSIFLAGSIEMGAAEDWQSRVIAALKDHVGVIYNPRRPDWDTSWEQSIDSPEFNAQVNWELDMIGLSDNVLFYFDPTTKSPISLMELGYCKGRGKSISVCCPEGFWRKGNVDILCEREGFQSYSDFGTMLDRLTFRY